MMGFIVGLLLSVGATSPDALQASLARRGIPEGAVVVAFESTPQIREFALDAVRGATDGASRAHRLYAALLALKRSGAIAGDRDNAPKERPPKSAAEVMRLAEDPAAADKKAGCYELSALYVAAARSVGLDAMGVEREASVGTGQIGHIIAGVHVEVGGRLTLFDLQNEVAGSLGHVRELDDLEFAAHYYNHLAVAAYLRGTLKEALITIDYALLLAPESASFLNNRATILGALDEPILAVAEVVRAVELAPDVPLYRYQLGRLYLVLGDVDSAVTALRQALELWPRYSLARRDLGWAYLLGNDVTVAERELRRALREDPSTPSIGLYLGLCLLSQGRRQEACGVAERGLMQRPRDSSLTALVGLCNDRAVGVRTEETAELGSVLERVAIAQARARASAPR